MPTPARPSLRLLALLPLLLTSLPGAPAAAQEAGTPTVEELEARIEALRGAGGEPDAAALGRYEEALAALQRAQDLRARAAQYQAETQEAPALLESLRAELASPPEKAQVEIDPALSLRDLTARYDQAAAEVEAARTLVDELARLSEQRKTRRAVLPQELAAAQQALDSAREALRSLADDAGTGARAALLAAQVEEHTAQVSALEAERDTYDARRELLPLRRDRASRTLALAQEAAEQWKAAVDAQRAEEGEQAVLQADRTLEDTERDFPELAPLAEELRELSALRSGEDGLPRQISRAQATLERTRADLEATNKRFRSASRRLEAAGLTEGMGSILRRDYEWLPQPAELRAESERQQNELSKAQLRLISLEEERSQVGDLTTALQELLDRLGVEDPSEDLREAARELLVQKREACDAAIAGIEALTSALYDQRSLAKQHRAAVRAYRAFIEENILWVRSSSPVSLGLPASLAGDALEVAREVGELPLLAELEQALRANALVYGALFLLFVALISGRRYLRRKRTELGGLVRSYRTDKYVHTLRALVQTLLIALPLPLAAWILGRLLADCADELPRSVGAALQTSAAAWVALRFLRGLLVEKGPGAAHFRWPSASLAAVRRELRWYEPFAVGLGTVYLALDQHSEPDWSDSIGRVSFLAVMAATAVLSHRLLREKSLLWSQAARSESSLLHRTRAAWAFVSTGLPVVLALLALFGYYYTALQFEMRLRYSFGLALGLVVVNALLLRWLFMVRRRLAVDQALEAKARKAEEELLEESATESGTVLDADQLDIPAIDTQTRKLFKSGITIATMLGLYFTWASVLPALQGLDRVQLLPELAIVSDSDSSAAPEPPGSSNGAAVPAPGLLSGLSPQSQSSAPAQDPEAASTEESSDGQSGLGLPATLTLADVLLALVFLVFTSVAARNLPALLELSLLQRLPLDSGARYAVTTIVRYLILLIGVSAISRALGIGWQQIQWLAAALTFGLAFGLQEIFANFVSGLIILLERPIRVGDIVTVSGTEGRVTQLRMRATTIQDWDRREFLVPNKEFITGSVINWTLSDPVTRIVIPVGIAYGSDTDKARKLLKQTATKHPLVLEDPAPSAIFRSFGASSLDFELRVFIGNRDIWPRVIDELHTQIDNAFRKAQIEIAFPQRDIHVRSVSGLELPGSGAHDREETS